jgi:putative transposase
MCSLRNFAMVAPGRRVSSEWEDSRPPGQGSAGIWVFTSAGIWVFFYRVITRPNEVWAMDITYIPMARGFVYLAVVMDWASRRVLSWRLSITLDSAFCIAAVEEAIARYGRPEIFNTDQGAQFTSAAFPSLLHNHGIKISMDGLGCWRDNIFVERLWRTLKYEEVYLHAYDSVSAAQTSIERYLTLYHSRRPHSSLADQTPDEAYFLPLSLPVAA